MKTNIVHLDFLMSQSTQCRSSSQGQLPYFPKHLHSVGIYLCNFLVIFMMYDEAVKFKMKIHEAQFEKVVICLD